ncbi:hypothetical protein [Aquipuribacter sp. MA13-6]|uniref:hypothetical protein n=1 Tax=unclassified Aquipuribacter TaxID=2635084 RepID=UPI003EE937CC
MVGLEGVRDLVEGTDPLWQWLTVLLAGAAPYVESYGAGAIGVLVGVPVGVAIVAAVVGNMVSMVLVVTLGDRIRRRRVDRLGPDAPEPSPRRQKLKRRFDRYGVAGVSLLGQTLLPSQVTSMAMVTFGADRRAVVLWQLLSITLWGLGFGLLAAAGMQVVDA